MCIRLVIVALFILNSLRILDLYIALVFLLCRRSSVIPGELIIKADAISIHIFHAVGGGAHSLLLYYSECIFFIFIFVWFGLPIFRPTTLAFRIESYWTGAETIRLAVVVRAHLAFLHPTAYFFYFGHQWLPHHPQQQFSLNERPFVCFSNVNVSVCFCCCCFWLGTFLLPLLLAAVEWNFFSLSILCCISVPICIICMVVCLQLQMLLKRC